AASAGKRQQAIKIYDDIAAKLADDDKSARFIRGRRLELTWQQKFEAGEWVDVTPDKKLTGWYPLQGQWTVDDQGRLVGTRKEGFLAVCLAGFLPDEYEVEATVDLGEEKRAVNGGICVEYYSTASAYGLNLRREAQQ